MSNAGAQVSALIASLLEQGHTVATCESLTGGLLVAALVDVPGASAVVRGGLVTYAADLKTSLAGVSAAHLAEFGPVNESTAREMAVGFARACGASIGVATTGVAGPEPHGGEPVGVVYVAVAISRQASREGDPEVRVVRCEFGAQLSRGEIRLAAVDAAVQLLCELI